MGTLLNERVKEEFHIPIKFLWIQNMDPHQHPQSVAMYCADVILIQ